MFLPRKFKIAVTVPGDNSVDLFTNDVGIVVITNPQGELQGYDVVVGGGMGRSHRCTAPPVPVALRVKATVLLPIETTVHAHAREEDIVPFGKPFLGAFPCPLKQTPIV